MDSELRPGDAFDDGHISAGLVARVYGMAFVPYTAGLDWKLAEVPREAPFRVEKDIRLLSSLYKQAPNMIETCPQRRCPLCSSSGQCAHSLRGG
jgi:hypothetical protein